jgi:hypothetical protein
MGRDSVFGYGFVWSPASCAGEMKLCKDHAVWWELGFATFSDGAVADASRDGQTAYQVRDKPLTNAGSE